ncbi:MAG: hypothetical protein V8R89_07970 [Alphaproteobacteria bacterium]|jgi:hypothetical protein|nr:MAG: hypothetical protein BHW58_07330 [Azospirillum sp. 51_20]
MFKKLIDGELSLKDTFWKFGVLGMLAVHLVVKILGTMLFHKLRGLTILGYYTTRKYGLETSTVILTILYFSSLCFLLFYAGSMVIGTWRSSAEYNRSLWFRHLARIFMILIVFVVLKHDLNL